MAEIKYDIRKGVDIYRQIDGSRLKRWISTGKIKKGEVLIWRSGLSGWRRPEELEEFIPLFLHWEKCESGKIKKKFRKSVVSPKKRIRNILVVDDEKDLCTLLLDVLSQDKRNVAVVNTIKKAIHYFKENDVDLVFLDLRLPDGDGIRLLSRIKKINPGVMVNIISAYGSSESREEAKRKGAATFIDKPFTEKEILRSIPR